MNTWVIGNWPVRHQVLTYPQPRPDPSLYTKPRKVPSLTPYAKEQPTSSSTQDTTSSITRKVATLQSDKAPAATLLGEKTFFMKARIMAGQADLKDNKFGLVDFKWLAKEEIRGVLDPREWNAVKNCLYER